MMISPIGSSCFKSDLDCDQILHIQWGSLFPASTSVVDGKIGRFIYCLSTDRIWDYLGSILRSGRSSKIDKSNTWVTCTSIRILEFFSKNNKLPRLYDVSNIHHSLEEAFSFPFMHFSIMQIGMWIFMRIKVTSIIAMPTYEKNEQFTY